MKPPRARSSAHYRELVGYWLLIHLETHQSPARFDIAITKIDFLDGSILSEAGQRPARTQPKAERMRCPGLRVQFSSSPQRGERDFRIASSPEISFGNHYRSVCTSAVSSGQPSVPFGAFFRLVAGSIAPMMSAAKASKP